MILLHDRPLALPAPTGPYAVGRTEYVWVDASRTDPLSETAGEKRQLLIWVWYPSSAGGSPAPYLPSNWVAAHNRDQGIGRWLERDYSSIQTHAFEDASLSKQEKTYPVLLMQPGMGPVSTDYTILAENLASHGYVVVGIDPTYTSNLIVFPDGRVVPRSEKGTIPDSANAAQADADANRIGKVWTDDAVFAIDRLQELNADPSSPFHNRLDLDHLGAFGHSFGGKTAISLCEIDSRCKAGADLDGSAFSNDLKGTLRQPFLFMTQGNCSNCDSMHRMYEGTQNASYYLSVAGAGHFNFSDLPVRLLPPARLLFRLLGFIGTIPPQRGGEIANAYLVAFFDKYLKGIDSELLRGASPQYPEVNFNKHEAFSFQHLYSTLRCFHRPQNGLHYTVANSFPTPDLLAILSAGRSGWWMNTSQYQRSYA
jgi:dienelactone hydrolase